MKLNARFSPVIAVLLALAIASPGMIIRAQEASPEAVSRMVSVYPANGAPGDYAAVTVDAGDSAEFTIILANAGDVQQTLRVYSIPALTIDNGGFAAAPYGSPTDDITSWLNLEEMHFDLEPNRGQELIVTVTVPEDVAPGEYVTAIAGEQADAFEIEGSDILTQRVRQPMPVLIVVPGELQYSFELHSAELELRQDFFIGSFRISNTGTAIVRPTGEVRVMNDAGEVLAVADVELGSVYTRSSANVYVAWQNVPGEGSYVLEISLTDPDNGATAADTFTDLVPVTGQDASVAATPAPELQFSEAELAPLTRDEPPSMLLFEGAISNPGDPIESARVSIVTYQDGEEVDRYPIMQAVTIGTGTTPVEARYSLPGGFTEGTYTFEVTIELGSGSTQTVLVTQPIDFQVTVDED